MSADDRESRANATSTLSENEESSAIRITQGGTSQTARRRPATEQQNAQHGQQQADAHHQHLEELEQQQQEEQESKLNKFISLNSELAN